MNKPEGHKFPQKLKGNWTLMGQGKSSESLKKNMKGKWTIRWNEELKEYEEIEGEFADGSNAGYNDDWNISSKSKGDLDRLQERHMKYSEHFKYLKESPVANKLTGGIGDATAPCDVIPSELAMGVQVEMEHTSDVKVATEIALDHLTEDPHYYTKLKAAGLTHELDQVNPSGFGDPTATFNQEDRLGNNVTCSPGNNIVGTIGSTPDGKIDGKDDSKPIVNKTVDIDVNENSDKKHGSPEYWANYARTVLAKAKDQVTRGELETAEIGVKSSDDVLAHLLRARLDNKEFASKAQTVKMMQGKSDNLEEDWKAAAAAGLLGLSSMMGGASIAKNKPVAPKPITQQAKKDIPAHFVLKTRDVSPANQSNIGKIAEKDVNIIAATLIGEAGGEGDVGMQAVLNVIMNRAKGDISKAAKVCLKPYQFSMWNGKQSNTDIVVNKAKSHPKWKTALNLINLQITGKLQDVTNGADFYFNPKLAKPSWAKSFKKTKTIGRHDFYNHGTTPISKFV